MLRWVEDGHHLVMQPTLRQAEKGVLADSRAKKLVAERQPAISNRRGHNM
jgi:hypothetical protein